MAYYGAGDYYTGDYYSGDNYGAYQAGGIFKSIGKAIRGVIAATPLGRAVSTLAPKLLGGGGPRPMMSVQSVADQGPLVVPVPGVGGAVQRFLPGGATGLMVAGGGRRRRINPLNLKALRRAMRRAKGFEKQARRVGSFFSPGKTYRLKGRARKRK